MSWGSIVRLCSCMQKISAHTLLIQKFIIDVIAQQFIFHFHSWTNLPNWGKKPADEYQIFFFPRGGGAKACCLGFFLFFITAFHSFFSVCPFRELLSEARFPDGLIPCFSCICRDSMLRRNRCTAEQLLGRGANGSLSTADNFAFKGW